MVVLIESLSSNVWLSCLTCKLRWIKASTKRQAFKCKCNIHCRLTEHKLYFLDTIWISITASTFFLFASPQNWILHKWCAALMHSMNVIPVGWTRSISVSSLINAICKTICIIWTVWSDHTRSKWLPESLTPDLMMQHEIKQDVPDCVTGLDLKRWGGMRPRTISSYD